MVRICLHANRLIADTLRDGVVELRKHAWAASTSKTRDSQWAKYVKFCNRVKIPLLPITCDNVCIFLLHLAFQGLCYSTINYEVSALVMFSKLYGCPLDIQGDFGVILTLKALRRLLGDHANSKDELYPSDLYKIFSQVNRNDEMEWTTWIGVVFLYRTLLRKCHIFSGEFNTNLLKRSSVQFTDYGFLVTLSNSKTIQYKERAVKIPVCTGGGILCAPTLLKSFMLNHPSFPEAPLLSRVQSGSLVPVSYAYALSTLKRWAQKAGLDKNIGLHSLRRGAATLMSLSGLNLEDIKERGDWRSLAVLSYLSYPMQRKVSIDSKVVRLLNSL